MIYVVEHLSKIRDILVSDINLLPTTVNYKLIDTSKYFVNNILFANVIHFPLDSTSDLPRLLDILYLENREEILLQNKNKFIITMIQFKPDNSKDVLYANSYLNLLQGSIEYNKLQDSPWHHFEILNYHTGKFEVHIKHDSAVEKLNQYMNEFVIEYKPNIVKEFPTKEHFMDYIDEYNV
jgi:hypothetical protein